MSLLKEFRYRKISQSVTVNDLLKEFFRKGIHLCAAFIPLFAGWHYSITVSGLSVILGIYMFCEYRRLNGHAVPVVSRITALAARSRDNGRFVLGPVTMALGVLFTILVFPLQAACIGIFALAFGDGVASLAGKLWGRNNIPYVSGKTVEGSLACFFAVFAATIIVTRNPLGAFLIAAAATGIELIPVRDYDNLIIPVLVALFAVYIG